MKGIWITWEFQRRNIGISTAMEYPLYLFDIKAYRPIRYIKSIFATLKAIIREKPDIVIAQNPSIGLTLFVILFSKIKKYYPVIDAHNSGIYPLEGRSKILMKLSEWIQRHSTLTIVTNQVLKIIVENNGGKAFVLPDAIPETPSELTNLTLKGEKNIACICTFSEDEPYKEIIEAASLLPDNIHIYITGNYGKRNMDINLLPENLHLTGYIPENEYWNLLYSSDIIIDLTLRENCLVCGAYEGVALNKPLILSNTLALKRYFSKGCVYTNPTQSDIYNAIIAAVQDLEILTNDIKAFKNEINVKWWKEIDRLKSRLNRLTE